MWPKAYAIECTYMYVLQMAVLLRKDDQVNINDALHVASALIQQ